MRNEIRLQVKMIIYEVHPFKKLFANVYILVKNSQQFGTLHKMVRQFTQCFTSNILVKLPLLGFVHIWPNHGLQNYPNLIIFDSTLFCVLDLVISLWKCEMFLKVIALSLTSGRASRLMSLLQDQPFLRGTSNKRKELLTTKKHLSSRYPLRHIYTIIKTNILV